MKVMEAVGKGFGNTGKCMNLILLVFVFNLAWNLAMVPFMPNTGAVGAAIPAGASPAAALSTFVFLLISIFVQGGMLGVIKDAIASDGSAALGNFTAYGKKFYLRFLGLMGLLLLAVLVTALIVALLAGMTAAFKNIIVNIIAILIGVVLVAVVGAYAFLFSLSPYAMVVDDVGILKALGNSMRFIRANVWRITGLLTLLVLIGLGIGVVGGAATALFNLALKGVALLVISGIISSAVSSYATVIVSYAIIAYYRTLSGSGAAGQEAAVSA